MLGTYILTMAVPSALHVPEHEHGSTRASEHVFHAAPPAASYMSIHAWHCSAGSSVDPLPVQAVAAPTLLISPAAITAAGTIADDTHSVRGGGVLGDKRSTGDRRSEGRCSGALKLFPKQKVKTSVK